jgi:quinol monooxygenase YgiN
MGRIVIACYRPKPGKREALRGLILDHVATLRAQGLVTDRAPITMEGTDGVIVEVFEWTSREAIEAAHTNPAVLAMWEQYSEVCDYVPLATLPEAAEMFAEFSPFDNEFGDPPDTLYAGGTPLFDETGGAGPPGKRKR